MQSLKALRQNKADALAKATSLFNAVQAANRDFTRAERVEYDAIMGETGIVAAINADIAIAERIQEDERNTPGRNIINVGTNRAANKPWKSMGEQMSALAKSTIALKGGMNHLADPRILAALGASESVPADGGFLVQPEYDTDLLQKIYNTGQVASLVGKKKMNSESLKINAVDESSRVDGSRWGGVLSYWLAEAQNYVNTKPKFRQVQLTANKLIALVYASEELLEDSAMLESYISDIVPQELAFQLDNAIVNGSGAGQPLGFMTSGSTIVQPHAAGETGSAGPSATDVLNMWSRLYAPYRADAVWFVNQSIEPSLIPMTIGAPSLGQVLIYTAPGVAGNASGRGMMFGRPVIPIEQTANIGLQGDIILWSPSGYLLAMRQELRADSSMHVAFLTGEMAFRFMMRADGQPWWKQPLTPYYNAAAGGTAPLTLGPTVILASRP
jgi:HK97 family phage major capsid protein